MDLKYALLLDIPWCSLFFYVPTIYMLEPKKGNRYLNHLAVVMMYAGWNFYFRYISPPANVGIYMISTWSFFLLLFLVFYQGTLKRKWVCLLSLAGVTAATEISAALLMVNVWDNFKDWYLNTSVEEEIVVATSSRIMGNLTGEVVIMMYALFYLCIVKKKRWKIFLSLTLIPIYQAFLAYGYFLLCDGYSERVAQIGLAMGIFNIVLDGMILYLLEGIFKKLDMQEKMLDISRRQQKEYEFYQSESQSVEQMRLIRHDFMNQLQTAYSMMDEPENADKVKDMIGQMKEKLEEKQV